MKNSKKLQSFPQNFRDHNFDVDKFFEFEVAFFL
jgi:hypothetical protein